MGELQTTEWRNERRIKFDLGDPIKKEEWLIGPLDGLNVVTKKLYKERVYQNKTNVLTFQTLTQSLDTSIN